LVIQLYLPCNYFVFLFAGCLRPIRDTGAFLDPDAFLEPPDLASETNQPMGELRIRQLQGLPSCSNNTLYGSTSATLSSGAARADDDSISSAA